MIVTKHREAMSQSWNAIQSLSVLVLFQCSNGAWHHRSSQIVVRLFFATQFKGCHSNGITQRLNG